MGINVELDPFDDSSKANLANEKINDIINKVDELDLMPQVAQRIMMVTKDKKATISDLEKTISLDQSLIAKILQIANSSFYGLEREVKTLRKAIVVLGLKELRDIAISAALLNMYGRSTASQIKNWDFAVGAAIGSKIISQELSDLETEECFISGLLLNIGRVVLNKIYPEDCEKVFQDYVEGKGRYEVLEEDFFGFQTSQLGYEISKLWNFSDNIQNVVRFSKSLPASYSHQYNDMQIWNIAIANMATLYCHRLGIGFKSPEPEVDIFGSEANQVLKLNMDRLEDIFETIKLAYYDNKCLFL